MEASASVAADGEIRFLRAHALVATYGHGLLRGNVFLGMVVFRQGEVREQRKIDSGRVRQGCG